ncbi:MAG: methyltransferase domain-containing protein [Bacteroidetes bacterium]|jgi:SAM-dependent methyltransferase|nr:methyltransferase domain-containing protein [Bacteroidota bacterium]MBT7828087.1 methyltransferase domain-containing protein [Bacteroidota bacterium]MBT7993938.1 methyltransferase domain-containing protein [Bacteroidota bacterium]
MIAKSFINYSKYIKQEDLKRLEFIENHVKSINRSNVKILDIGCGNGNISFQMAKTGATVIGIDQSEDAIERAQSNFNHENLTFVQSKVEEYQSHYKFDIIICSEILEHLVDPEIILIKLTEALKEDGMLIVTVPNGYGPRELFITQPVQWINSKDNLLTKILRSIKSVLGYTGYTSQSDADDLIHYQFFTIKRITRLISKYSMHRIDLKSSNFISGMFPFSLLVRLIPSLEKFDCFIIDYLPKFLSSGFNMVWVKTNQTL